MPNQVLHVSSTSKSENFPAKEGSTSLPFRKETRQYSDGFACSWKTQDSACSLILVLELCALSSKAALLAERIPVL